ncbi:hypothetical protein O3M35_009750 [Rhynocoris fuscipes]|uniref:Uncharacterized protein n=1 Tax=Rhynocoris fuscipes TaxID=488301 RepID=A0AAW1D4U8_9HEMI
MVVLFYDFNYRQFLIQTWIPWNTNEISTYLLANLFVNTMIFTCQMAHVVFASVMLTFTFQISAWITILQRYLETRGPVDQKIYKYHETLIHIIIDYNKIFSGPLYVETLCSSLWPCGIAMTLIRMSQGSGCREDKGAGLSNRLLTTAVTGSIQAELQMERLHESSYMSKWYEETPKVRRDLLILMTRTTKSITVNYRLFVTFDRECLAKIRKPWNTDEIWAYLLANVYVTIMVLTYVLVLAMFTSVELAFTFQTSACLKVLQTYMETRGPADQIIYQYHDTLIQ